jgi:acyl-CoA synthetase (NDP forming)/GNAT superfamily N-acetyltransferase
VRQMHAAMSPDNIYWRFFNMSPGAAEQEAGRVCREPGEGHAALLAWLGGQLVGVASYEPAVAPAVADVAVAVADHMHGRGVATLLLEHLVSIGRHCKLQAFTAKTLAANAAVRRVAGGMGLPAKQEIADGIIDLTFPLPYDDAESHLDSYLDAMAGRERLANVASLRHLLQPTSVAVVGASRRPVTVGRAILRNIVTGGFAGHVYAVSPHASEIEGAPCVPSVASLPEPVDVAVVAVPAAAVREVADQCGRRGIRALVVIAAGFDAGTGADLLAICRRHGMRLVGPNCFGIAVPHLGLNATFAATHPAPGDAGLIVQSDGVGVALLGHLSRLGVGVSSFASVGDKYDVSGNDMLMWWEQDGLTRLAVLYMESSGSPWKCARTVRQAGATMPVLTVHARRSAAGQQAGIVTTSSLGELLEAAALLASQPLPAGDRVAVVSNAGGGGVLAADACADSGLRVAALAGQTRDRLRQMLPPGAAVTDPVDTTAAAPPATFRSCLEVVAADDGVDMVLAVTVPNVIADLVPAITTADVAKPLAAALLTQAEAVRLLPPDSRGNTHSAPHEGREVAHRAVPCYAYPESAARAFGYAARYQAWRTRDHGTIPHLDGVREADARALAACFLARHCDGGWLSGAETTGLLSCYGIPLVATRAVTSEQGAVQAAAGLGGRLALKADVPGLVHKSDAGGVQLGLSSEEDVRRGYRTLASTFGSRLRQVLVQPMISGGVEVLIGITQEPVFGPLVVFGLGGVTADVLGDHTARLAPLTDIDAAEMIREVRAAPLLSGHRGTPAADVAALAGTLLRVSRLAGDLPEVAELDLNPVIARPDGVSAVGARVRLSPAEPQDPFLRRLR